MMPTDIQVPIDFVADQISVDPAWLTNLIAFESNFDPQAKNPRSSARGLLQFIDATARDLGFHDSLDLVTQYPTFAKQMYGPVLTYLRRYAPFGSKQSLYMAVFYPMYRNADGDLEFPAHVVEANPGIETPADYVALVDAMGEDVVPGAGAIASAFTEHKTAWKIAGLAVVLAGLMYITHSG